MESENESVPLCPALVVFIIPPLDVVTSGSELLSVSKSVTGSMKTNVLDYCKNVAAQKTIYHTYIFFDLKGTTIVYVLCQTFKRSCPRFYKATSKIFIMIPSNVLLRMNTPHFTTGFATSSVNHKSANLWKILTKWLPIISMG